MGKKRRQEGKNTKVKIESISVEMYDHNEKLVSQFERPIDAPDVKQNKDNIDTDNSSEKLQQNEKNGFIEGLKILTDSFPLISGMIIASIVITQIFYANIAEQYYHIEKSLFFTEIVYDILLNVGEFTILNLSFLLLTIVIYNSTKDIHLIFYFFVFFISCAVLVIGLYIYAESISQGIYPAEDVNRVLIKYPLISLAFILLLSFLGTVGFWIMFDNTVVSHLVQKKRMEDGNKEKAVQETGCSKSKKVSNSNSSENEFGKSKMIKGITAFICFICVLAAFAVIGVWLWNFILGGVLIINKESYPKKKTYEIVQNNNYTELTDTSGQITSASNIQVVILHRGSQVLLMNGEIDGNEVINPQEDVSSSNLVIDTSSYEFQEANQYRFYRKTFNNVTTNAPKNND